MNLLGKAHPTIAPITEAPAQPTIKVVTFERTIGHGPITTGRLTYVKNGLHRTLEVGMTWEALAQLRSAAQRLSIAPDDERIVEEVLSAWTREQVEQERSVELDYEPLVLTFSGGPLSSEPRRLLLLAGLAPQP